MNDEREALLAKISSYFKNEEKYKQEQQFVESFALWEKQYSINPSAATKDESEIVLKSGNPEAGTTACNSILRTYQNLVKVCGVEGYEGIGYLLNYTTKMTQENHFAIKVPRPIMDLARIDLHQIWDRKKPIL